jgi:SAM-dependent methyltransferase
MVQTRPMDDDVQALVAEQIGYYRAHARDYDNDIAGLHPDWSQSIDELPITGDVLELACGSGRWTRLLAARARSVTAVDAAPEMLAIARQRVGNLPVELIQADVLAWEPPRRYDTVFFAFWLSHVPPTRLPAFWSTIASMLAPGGRAIFIDDGPAAAASEERVVEGPVPTVLRRLDDGSEYRIVKVFHDARVLTAELTALEWTVRVRSLEGSIVGVAEPPASPHPTAGSSATGSQR